MTRNKRKYTAIAILAVVILLGGAFALSSSAPKTSSQPKKVSIASSETVKATAIAELNKQFKFKAINQKRETKEVSFTIITVERKDEIKVKGETRRAPRDFDFMLVRVEIENTLPEKLAITPSDLIRLEDERGKLFSPDYHNGNVILDPLSVKKDLISFIVPKNTKKFVFQVGELDGKKEKVEVNF